MKQNNEGNQLRVIGLTGGIGAGKSTVAKLVKEALPVEVISTDDVARKQMEVGQASYDAVVKEFGTSFLNKDLSIDRAKLAALIFCSEERVKKMNELTHPKVKEEVLSQINRLRQKKDVWAVLVESALLFDANFDKFCDEVWYVDAPKTQRIERLIVSRGYTKEKAEMIILQQKMEEVAKQKSDLVINNSNEKTIQNVLEQIMGKMENIVELY